MITEVTTVYCTQNHFRQLYSELLLLVVSELLLPAVFGSGCRFLTCRNTAAKESSAYAVAALAERQHPAARYHLAAHWHPAAWVTVEMPGAVSLRPALTPGLRLNPLPLFV